MALITLLLGIIIGILVRDIKTKGGEAWEKVKEEVQGQQGVQFVEPVTDKEKLEKAKTIQDLIE